MKALSIRQPWAWLIVHGGKDIENRRWPTAYRGPLLIHAAKGMTDAEYGSARDFAQALGVLVPAPPDLQRGGIVGQVDLADCVTSRDLDRIYGSNWFCGPFGFVLRNPRPLAFVPLRGSLGLFEAAGIQEVRP